MSKEQLNESLPLWARVLRELGSFALVAAMLYWNMTSTTNVLEKIQETEVRIVSFLDHQSRVLDKLEARLAWLENRALGSK